LLYIGKNLNPVKNIFLLFICAFYLTNGFSQETIERKNRLTDSVIERFYVLKSARETKEGPYKAFFKRKTLIAAGNYTKGKKTGVWQFFNTQGILVEKFDYNTNNFTFESVYNKMNDVSYLFDAKLQKGDTVTRPLKPGGVYYGYIPYLQLFRLPFDSYGVNTDAFDADIELLVSPLGRLAEYKVHLTSGWYRYDHTVTMDVHLLNEEDQRFMPATLNGKPILSRIIIKCFVNSEGLDFF
jgi:hypothetical protein